MGIKERLDGAHEKLEKSSKELRAEPLPKDEGLKVKTVIGIIGITIFIVGVIGLLILNAC